MIFDRAFLRSKVGRRIFILFIACALLLITALAAVSFYRVTRQLEMQSQRRLHQAARDAGVVIIERMKLLESEMKIVASTLSDNPSSSVQPMPSLSTEDLSARFKALALITSDDNYVPLFGKTEGPKSLSAVEQEHLASGKTLLTTHPNKQGPRRIFMRRTLNHGGPKGALLVAEIEPLYLLGTKEEGTLPPMIEFCVVDHLNNLLYSSLSGPHPFPEQEMRQVTLSHSGQFEWERGDTAYVARYSSLFTRFDFFAPKWVLVMSEPKDHVFAPMADFKKTFSLIFLLSLWVVLLMSLSQIRRSLIPLEKLQEGTRRIAQRDFQTKVSVTSGDEFEELAASFNAMAERLGRQFNTMTIMNEIDRSILSTLDTKKIANTVLTRMSEIFPCDCVGLALLKNKEANTGLMYVKDDNPRSGNRLEPIRLTSLEKRELHANPEYALIGTNKEIPQYLSPLAGLGMNLFLVLPIFLNETLSAMIALGYRVPMSLADEDHVQARQLADQVAVALSNAQLIEDLEELSWGTLYALARAIDTKSKWTYGHSERVTKLALKIGRVMGLGEKELEDLQRAGLLHDIGKLGIPPEILDKPAQLTQEEYRLMRKHPQMGARILEPIAAYAAATPIVLHHHENYDGSGYPSGLAGEDIVLGARIFAVADQFDAITSDRPYRSGLNPKRVIEYIKQRAGQRFDPDVVRAFLQVMRQEQRTSKRKSP